jgi:hypothetical protein
MHINMNKRKIDALIVNLVENEIYSKRYLIRELCIKYKVPQMYPELVLVFAIDDDYETETEESSEDDYIDIEEPPIKILKDVGGFYSIDVGECKTQSRSA